MLWVTGSQATFNGATGSASDNHCQKRSQWLLQLKYSPSHPCLQLCDSRPLVAQRSAASYSVFLCLRQHVHATVLVSYAHGSSRNSILHQYCIYIQTSGALDCPAQNRPCRTAPPARSWETTFRRLTDSCAATESGCT